MADSIKQLGLIGNPLSHSFSRAYFTRKFDQLGIDDYQYQHFELETIDELKALLERTPSLIGLNVTIPYKKQVIPYLDELSPEARVIGAVNVIKISRNKISGYNSDYYGFKNSLLAWLPKSWTGKALVLGTGGASLAVHAVLSDCNIPFIRVSRNPGDQLVTYRQTMEMDLLSTHRLIINTTPLGMHPHIDRSPELEYHRIGSEHYLFDLVYNPETTKFMLQGMEKGAQVKNGLEMLELQAERSWEIWTGNN